MLFYRTRLSSETPPEILLPWWQLIQYELKIGIKSSEYVGLIAQLLVLSLLQLKNNNKSEKNRILLIFICKLSFV